MVIDRCHEPILMRGRSLSQRSQLWPSFETRKRTLLRTRLIDVSWRAQASGTSSCLLLHAPELKPVSIDCLLDGVARELMGRRFVRRHDAGSRPGAVTFRKLASAQIACECTQLTPRLRFEY